MKPVILHIEISGATATGKTAVLARIRDALQAEGYTVASPDLDAEMRMIRPGDLKAAPRRQTTVIVLSEHNERQLSQRGQSADMGALSQRDTTP